MAVIRGRYFDGHSSAFRAATIHVDADGTVHVEGLPEALRAPLADLEFSDRVGNIPRRVQFPDGGMFETEDNDGVNDTLAAFGRRGLLHTVSRWEGRWSIALGALAAVALLSWAFVQYGIPRIADAVAFGLPPALDRTIGAQTLEVLDRSFLEPTQLDADQREHMEALFADMTSSLDDGHEYRLELRHGAALGANAFALPSGIVVVTDELHELAQNDEELMAVLAHEIGHVRGRHSLRMLLRSAGVAALTLALFGDVSMATTIASAVPTVLLQAQHSREFETEADDFAYAWLDEHDVPEHYFGDILARLAQHAGHARYSWLSSHPPTAQRIRH